MEEVLFTFIIVVIMVAAIVGVSRSSSSNGGISSSPASYGGALVGKLNLTNSTLIDYPGGSISTPVTIIFDVVVDLVSDLFSFNTSTKEITVSRSGNYVISFDLTPSDNSVPTIGQFDTQIYLRLTSVTKNTVILFAIAQVVQFPGATTFNLMYSGTVYLPADVYSIPTTAFVSSSPANSRVVPANFGRFSITTLY